MDLGGIAIRVAMPFFGSVTQGCAGVRDASGMYKLDSRGGEGRGRHRKEYSSSQQSIQTPIRGKLIPGVFNLCFGRLKRRSKSE